MDEFLPDCRGTGLPAPRRKQEKGTWESGVTSMCDITARMTQGARPVRPLALVDAVITKRNPGTTRDRAAGAVTLGPGLTSGVDTDAGPRQDKRKNCFTVSDKARCIAGSAPGTILHLANERGLAL